jgi:hypothetical protein
LLSKIYAKQNKIDLAFMYGKKSLSTCEELSNRIAFYENITRLYLQKSDYQTAFQYQDSLVQAKDSLANLINRSHYEMNKVKFKTQEYQNELKAEKERKQNQQKIFLGIAVFGLLVFIMIYMALRNNIIKQKHKAIITDLQLEKEREEHLSAEKELQINKLKQEKLKHEVAEKNREFAAKALYLTKRNKLIEDIILSLEANSQKFSDKQIGGQIRSIKNILKADDQQEDFMIHFESVNPVFLKQLKNKHPELTANDIRFLCYVFMNLSIKEIADILNITYNACKKRKWKIQEKMDLNRSDSLYDYLFSI